MSESKKKVGGGRKKKVVDAEVVVVNVKAEAEEVTSAAASKPGRKAAAPRGPKKEKKPVHVVAVVTPNGIDGSFTPESRRPLIVHLPFRNSEVSFNDSGIHYDPSPPPQVQPYDNEGQVYFQVNTESSSDEIQIGVEKEGWKMNLEEILKAEKNVEEKAATVQAIHPEPQQKKIDPLNYDNFQRTQLLACYVTKPDENFRVPETTEVACFWCAHTFENMPCFLPVKEEYGTYHVYGNFCTPQCSLSYLLNEHLDSHVRWERMALLHRMYRPTGKASGRLYPAPPRESLQKFGGVYTYTQFRELISESKVRIDIQIPPMVSILGTLDTKPIDFYDSSLQNTFTGGFSMDRFKSWSEQGGALRLKRSKPLKDKESTLDACIKISVKRGTEA